MMRISEDEARQRGWLVDLTTRRKYGNQPTVADGIRFDSKKEARRWMELRMLHAAGVICSLEAHPCYRLHGANGQDVGRFTADFRYALKRNGEVICEDTKSPVTRKETAYRLRKKLVEAEYGITVVEI